MYLYGSFLTQQGDTVTVHIVTENSRTRCVEIGAPGSGVLFSSDPVNIESSVNDTFDHLLRSSAVIRLLTRDFIPDLFCASCMNAVVNIFRGDECVFAGFIEPQAYSQSYNEVYDNLEISCIDALSALQNAKYRNVGGLGVLYEEVRAGASQLTFSAIMDGILGNVCDSIDITGAGGIHYYYDGSKALTGDAPRYGIFNQLSISELLFLGDSEDDVWQQDQVLTAMLKYLNLHIVQDGLQFYIFSWESVKGNEPIVWHDLKTGASVAMHKNLITIDESNVAGADTTISIGEVFNQIKLTCKIESIENIIESPLDGNALVSPYTNRQKYLTELSADGTDVKAFSAFSAMCHDQVPDYADGVITDWYIQVRNNPHWVFPEAGTGDDLIDKYCRDNANQHMLPNLMPKMPCAALLSLGKVENKTDHKDNSPVSKIDMTDYLVVSVNGNGSDDPQKTYPTENSLRDSIPCAVYTGACPGGVYSPSDECTTNYIVLSGNIVLNPLMDFSCDYKTAHENTVWDLIPLSPKPVPSRNNDAGRYYTHKYYKAGTPTDSPVWDEDTVRGLVPFTGTGPEQYEFKYSAVGDRTDKISKIAVLACMLIIGDKCVVETGTSGQISDFEWRKYKTRDQCADDDEYYQQCFTIGFDPKISDKLIGTQFRLQNNIDYNVGIDAEGIAIPIRKADKLSGTVRFMILGPVNSVWDEITRRHPTFFRHTRWSSSSIPLLAHVSSIFLQSFEVKIYSDNGLINNTEDNDIIYVSDTGENFVNCKDDIDFEINSALTLKECQQLGVTDAVKLSTPLDRSTGDGLLSIYDYDRKEQAKPEQLYVDSYYNEYHRPRIQMTQKLVDSPADIGLFNHYRHPAMTDKLFYVQGLSRNLIEGYAELMLKEVWND
ncbi:MAG: hypothetical protein Q4F07_06800 [Bacteroidales bacterium]|nr:hypothetical protein [Bacteroidales bacterium]